MKTICAALFFLAPVFYGARAADLAEPPFGPAGGFGGSLSYGELWSRRRDVYADRSRPARRVMGGPDYVGSNYGLAKPPYLGIGPRPDWGRSTYD